MTVDNVYSILTVFIKFLFPFVAISFCFSYFFIIIRKILEHV